MQGGALVHIYQHDGSVSVAIGGVEMGQGLFVKIAQVSGLNRLYHTVHA